MRRYWQLIIMVILLGLNQWCFASGSQVNKPDSTSDKAITVQPKVSKLAIESSTEPLLDNNTWSDYPVDDDRNGFYNRLVVDLGEPFLPDQNYGVYGVLKDSEDNLLGISTLFYWEIREGFQLSFAGAPINASGSTGPYIVWVGVFTPGWWGYIPEVNFTLSYTTSLAYNPNEFESPTAKVIGFSDYGNDTEEDNYYDEIIVELTLEVFERGYYEAVIFLDSAATFPGSDYEFTSYWNGFLTPGEEIIEFHLPTRDFQIKRKSGPFNVSFITLTFYGEYQQFLTNAYETNPYFYRDFDPTYVELTGNYWDQGVDTDSDGRFDQLAITVEINVTKAGNYRLELQLKPNATDDWYFNQWNGIEGYWTKGIHNRTVYFDAARYFSLYHSFLFVIEYIQIFDSDWTTQTWAEYPYITRVYSHQEFDFPNVFLTGNYWDQGQDLDLDGTFDQLVIKVEINVTTAGNYRLDLLLKPFDNDDWYFDQVNGIDNYWTIGIHIITLYFDACRYYSIQKDTSFIVDYIEIHDSNWNTITRVSSPYITQIYNYNEFDKPGALLTGRFWDYGEDLDSDGAYDQLTLIFEVSIIETGEYRFSCDLRVNTSYSGWSEWRDTYGYWVTGIYNISLSFDTSSFYSTHENNTFYLENIEIRDSDWNTIGRAFFPYTTRIYNYTEFDVPGAYLTGNYWDNTEDTDSDGKINFLVFTIEVNVTRKGDYQIEYEQQPLIPVWDSGSWEYSFEYLNLGVHNLSFQHYLTIPYSLRLDTAYVFSNFRIHDINWNLLNWDDSSHITRIYAYNEFDPPGVYLTGNYWDYGVDIDSDGTFDQINIEIEVNVTQSGVYNFDGYWYAATPSGWWKSEGYYDEDVFFKGIQNITLPINAKLLYTSFDDIALHLENFRIYDSDGHLLDRFVTSYETRYYSYQELDPPGVSLTGYYWDHGIDTDSDGKYEEWAIEIQVNVVESGYYTLELELYTWPDYNYWSESVSGYWEVGIQIITVSTSASNFYSNQQEYIHFEVNVIRIIDSNGNIIAEEYYPFYSSGYSPNAFDLRYNPTTTTTSVTSRQTPSWNEPFGIVLILSILVILVLRNKIITKKH